MTDEPANPDDVVVEWRYNDQWSMDREPRFIDADEVSQLELW